MQIIGDQTSPLVTINYFAIAVVTVASIGLMVVPVVEFRRSIGYMSMIYLFLTGVLGLLMVSLHITSP